jgi:hypothetical protein
MTFGHLPFSLPLKLLAVSVRLPLRLMDASPPRATSITQLAGCFQFWMKKRVCVEALFRLD